MEARIYLTRIKGRHKLSNEYTRGRISGIALMTIGSYSANRLIYDDKLENDQRIPERGDLILTNKCTPEEYANFRKQVEVLYPGLCIFDYKGRVK